MSRVKYAVAVAGTVAGLLVPAMPAVAGGTPEPPKQCHKQKCKPPKAKCNSGRGNGSELRNGVDCDPGRSGGRNNGGD